MLFVDIFEFDCIENIVSWIGYAFVLMVVMMVK